MQKLNDTPNSPLRYVTEDGQTIGQFYNSWDKQYHLAGYVPNKEPPREYLCCKRGNFSPSREEGSHHKRCAECFDKLKFLARRDGSMLDTLGLI